MYLGCHCSHVRGGDGCRGRSRLRTHRTQPPGGEPGARNRKLRPAAIKANLDIGRRRHGGVAEGAMTIAIKTNLSRNDGQGRRLALRTIHECTSGTKNNRKNKNYNLGRNSTVIFFVLVFQRLCADWNNIASIPQFLEYLRLLHQKCFKYFLGRFPPSAAYRSARIRLQFCAQRSFFVHLVQPWNGDGQKNAAAEAAALSSVKAALEVDAGGEFNITRSVGEVAAV
jgi:hypothetical protein